MDPNTITLRHVPDVNLIWYGEPGHDSPKPGWLVDGIDFEEADTFLADTRDALDDKAAQDWAAGLISRCTNYRVTGWRAVISSADGSHQGFAPRLVERRHEMTFFDNGGDAGACIKHDFGAERWAAQAALAALKDPDAVIELRRPAKREGACLTETTLHIPVRNLVTVRHVVTEHEVSMADRSGVAF